MDEVLGGILRSIPISIPKADISDHVAPMESSQMARDPISQSLAEYYLQKRPVWDATIQQDARRSHDFKFNSIVIYPLRDYDDNKYFAMVLPYRKA